tara:strand:+ start:1774 stop:2376 length:603 start_codon:yes stop_codon:yes gene_type:complete
MISSKAMGYMLIMGLVGFAVMIISFFMQGNQEGTTGVVAWAAESNDWENVGMVRMLAVFSNLIFVTGFIYWARSINNSSSAIAIGSTFALLSIVLVWVSFISHVAGYETASDNTTAALGLIELGNIAGWFSGLLISLSFFLVGLSAYRQKVGMPALNILLAIAGLAGAVANFVWVVFFMGGFGLGLLILAIIGLKKIKGD